MFKCSECGAEYEIKPEYCDCGNNIFYETGKEINDIDLDDTELDNLTDDNMNSVTRRSKYSNKTSSPVAICVFTLCIVLSFVVLFFIGNPKKTKQIKTQKTHETVQTTDIPSIDAYWDNTAIVQSEPQNTIENEQKQQIPEFVKKIIPQPQGPIQTDVTITKTPIKPAPVQLKNLVPKKNTSLPKSSSNKTSKKSSSVTHNNMNKTSTQSSFSGLSNKIKNQYSQTSKIPKVSNNTTKTTSPSKPAPIPTKSTPTTAPTIRATNTTTVHPTPRPAAKSSAQLKQEVSTYKNGLRNTIGRKIDFTKVIGDGSCSLAFKVDSNGRLYSKSFTKQSSNLTLNEAVFYALNTTTSYNPPPEGYKGETLRLYIRFYNGNFEISLQ